MPEDPSIPVLVERIANIQSDVTEIKRDMATRSDQAHVDERIAGLVGALSAERAERIAAIAVEKQERVDGDKAEAAARRKVSDRLQLVEDRLEARKYNVGIAILLAAFGSVLGVLSLAFRPLFGG